MEELKFYQVKDDYIDRLKEIDNKVMDNKPNLHQRPYCGIVLRVNNLDYYVPLSSVKEGKNTNTRLSRKILDLKGKPIAYLCFLNMIPVKSEFLIEIDINNYRIRDKKYFYLLLSEYLFIKDNKEDLIKKANQVYENRCYKKFAFFVDNCCDFELLEEELKK